MGRVEIVEVFDSREFDFATAVGAVISLAQRVS
jgi:hypothetical protein